MDLHTLLVDAGMVAFLVLLVYVLVKLLARPIKALLKFAIHAGTGLLVFYAVNYVGERFFNFTMDPTRLRLLIAAVGGIPGVVLMVLYQLLF